MNKMNEFNEKFGKNYHVGPSGLVINGIQRNMILTPEMQKNIMRKPFCSQVFLCRTVIMIIMPEIL